MVRAFFARSTVAAMTSLFVLGAAGGAFAQDAEKDSAVVTVNGKVFTTTELGYVAAELGPRLAQMPAEQQKSALTQVVIDLALVAQAAQEQKLDQSDAFKQQMDFLRMRALRNEYFRKNVDEAVTEADMKAAYEEQIAAAPVRQQLKARHILLKEEAEALSVIKELDGGADFAELAKAKSTGPSAPNGGDLGFFGQGQMVPAFEAAAFALDKGAYTKAPVKTQFGWHVILAEDKKDQPKPTFEQVEKDIRTFLTQKKFSELLSELKATAKIEMAK
ncbi:peptidylprolyl isomerase [Cohaesibacter celericrescens]|uniref:peptidylprolyl isomerase n=1 Tax=Cohaesibacter celericrescens TaxID=2067669 RepID=UPI003567CB81